MEDTRDSSIDLMRAIAILLVMFWHIQPIRFLAGEQDVLSGIIFAINTFNTQVSLLAVPLFYIISFYIFHDKAKIEKEYFQKRFLRVASICIFWTAIQFMVFIVMSIYYHGHIQKIPVLLYVMAGGPDLPVVGGSVFYYLTVMTILTPIVFYYNRFGNKRILTMTSLIVIGFFLSYFEYTIFKGIAVPYWRIDSFLIYVPAVHLLFNYNKVFRNYWYVLLAIYLLFSLHDIVLAYSMNYHPPIYARISIFFGSMSLFSMLHGMRIREMALIKFLSKYSLGIFATHKYCQLIIFLIVSTFIDYTIYQKLFPFAAATVDIPSFFIGVLTFVMTTCSVYFLGKTPLKRMIS